MSFYLEYFRFFDSILIIINLKNHPSQEKQKTKQGKKQIKGKADAKKQDYTLPTDYGKMAKQ